MTTKFKKTINYSKNSDKVTNDIENKLIKNYSQNIDYDAINDQINSNDKYIQKEFINNQKDRMLKKRVKNDLKKELQLQQNQINNKTPHNKQSQNINIDSIINDLIPQYNNQVSIELNHVNLTFEIEKEKIDTLKESFIRTIKGNKSEKLKLHALKDITFKIYKGEKVGIIGFNGAGKSTLLNVITGIYPIDDGEMHTNGRISPLLSLGAGFDYNYTGRKNILLNGAVLGQSKEYIESKMDEIIEFSELGEFIDIPIKNYSSGMLAKLGFSIATAVNPDILIIDEILSVGDINFQKKSADKIRSLMDEGTTVILVSHSIAQIRELCDKAIWIDNGKIKKIGEVNKVCDKYVKYAEKASNEQLANIQLR